MKKEVGLWIVIALAIIILASLVFIKQPLENTSRDLVMGEPENLELTGETKEFTVRAFQFDFEPNLIEVNLGDRVIINAYSSDVPHGFAINEFNVNMKLEDTTMQTTEFIADKKGVFTFYCFVPCGRSHGSMRGQFVVN